MITSINLVNKHNFAPQTKMNNVKQTQMPLLYKNQTQNVSFKCICGGILELPIILAIGTVIVKYYRAIKTWILSTKLFHRYN